MSHGTKCSNALKKVNETVLNITNDTWQNARSRPLELYVYSAFTDPRYTNMTLVRVIGIVDKLFDFDQLECQIILPGTNDSTAFPIKSVDFMKEKYYHEQFK